METGSYKMSMRFLWRQHRYFQFSFQHRFKQLKSKLPAEHVCIPVDESKLPPRTKIDQATIEHLERISLVDFANKRGIQRLEEAIAFADQIRTIDTTGVEPMVTVLEDQTLFLREDEVTEGNCTKDILANASVTEEEYFVSPPGNIPLSPRTPLIDDKKE